MMPKPRHIAAALPDVTARRAGDWLRGTRSPPIEALARIVEAFPALDARWFVCELARRRREQGTKPEARRADGGPR